MTKICPNCKGLPEDEYGQCDICNDFKIVKDDESTFYNTYEIKKSIINEIKVVELWNEPRLFEHQCKVWKSLEFKLSSSNSSIVGDDSLYQAIFVKE